MVAKEIMRGAYQHMMLLARDTQFRQHVFPFSVARVRTSTNTNVPPSYPIRSISPLLCDGE
jgi:hypothetical protein